ncbi:MAG: zinc-binding dehydrogenase [Rhodospirillaceae bacterium]|nr:zinc-binding dehydrogenase [Rhodospirillaceae bacterium]MBT3926594.1 zinc-binding dehydrogenase [Rhodospirillaceae bacterium]MBT4427821.1 zinc-binding dehydrogenase [Rhodospirillaceae bacterium]MBT5037529.1 zinc-binding dehydrogenase [Rhodospirillaceae bacterium]MBT5779074.1 zinc-binding dehydrogenase [Rhodospirillaceae bacterium]
MKAAILTESGLMVGEAPRPEPGASDILVRVRAAALNRADILMADGRAHGKLGGSGAILGLEWAGEVAETGSKAQEFKEGDRVMCSGAAGYAEYAVTDWGRVSPLPAADMSFEQAATLPIALQTMHDALATNGRLQKGETVLIQGASSGVGLMGLQIAKYLGAKLVIGTTRDSTRRARLGEFGADLALDPSDPTWPDAVLEATGGAGVNLIVDQISGGVANQNMQAAAVKGRIVNVGRLGGFSGEFDYDLHALKRIDYIGVTFRTRSVEEVREINRRMRAALWPAVENGTLQLPLDRVFPLDQAVAAQAHMRANAHFGKVVLSV